MKTILITLIIYWFVITYKQFKDSSEEVLLDIFRLLLLPIKILNRIYRWTKNFLKKAN